MRWIQAKRAGGMDAQAGIGRQYVDRSERFLHRLDQRLGSVRFTEVCRERRGFTAAAAIAETTLSAPSQLDP